MIIVIFDVTETRFNFRTCIDDGLGRIVEIILDKSTHNYGLLSYANNKRAAWGGPASARLFKHQTKLVLYAN